MFWEHQARKAAIIIAALADSRHLVDILPQYNGAEEHGVNDKSASWASVIILTHIDG